mmetsp:Transcript_11747/g.24482  ORF Transcript_11747/g.24482 Transcript_11747/m.24482 type:complete len:91 (-) Transcript_11747:35-307(-)
MGSEEGRQKLTLKKKHTHEAHPRPAEELSCTASELRASSLALGRVVLLDRFRPMLLPRHHPDVLAGLFQSDRFRIAAKSGDKEDERGDSG